MSKYSPIPPYGKDKEDPTTYVIGELMDLAKALDEPNEFMLLQVLNVAPEKPRNGMIALADGTNWNPGAGAGFYGYYGGAWAKLG